MIGWGAGEEYHHSRFILDVFPILESGSCGIQVQVDFRCTIVIACVVYPAISVSPCKWAIGGQQTTAVLVIFVWLDRSV